jgi:NAD(P) transhydrogenase subunit alpha
MTDLAILTGVFVSAFALGYFLIIRIPSLLHTPLMSMTNAISAITIIGGIVLFSFELSAAETAIGVIALFMAAFNVAGGFIITDRMTKLFKK